jgi:hypothetical protein
MADPGLAVSDPQREAAVAVGGRYDVRVLEPSPPSVREPPWFADDPVAPGEPREGRQVVSPVPTADLLWSDLAGDDAPLADFCRARWLGPWKRLEPLPPGFAETRLALHRVAEDVMKPAREQANGKFGLRYTRGGFGTPFFGADEQLRVERDELVAVKEGAETRTKLDVDPDASAALGDWFGFAASVLEELRAEASPELEPSRVQIWPEHFDMALELGPESRGRRAGYGCSPGDDEHPEPYVYVTPWEAPPPGELWNATAFGGAELPYPELLASGDQRQRALDFFRARLDALN